MATVIDLPAPPAGEDDGGDARTRRWRPAAVAVPAGVAALVAVLAQFPLLHNRLFYIWDDSAAQFMPMYRALGERLLAGQWPVLLDLDSWMGGNLAAEALFGVWNPVNALNEVLVALLPDLAVAAAAVKTEFLVLLAVGTYLLCREYGAARWASSVVAVALPFSGFTLYYDAGSWASGLFSFAWVPLLWWSVRRCVTGRMLAIWPFVIGYLTITTGNPYGLLAAVVMLLGLLGELVARGRGPDGPSPWPAVRRLVLLGLCLAGTALLVYLPLIGSSPTSWRTSKVMFNDGMLVPSLDDLLNLSMPSQVPRILGFNRSESRLSVPAAYFAWFVMPLLPWLDWSGVRARWRPQTGAVVFTGCFLAAALGPSNLWMFRWPLRLVEYVYLGVGVLFAVVLSAGLRTDRPRRRATVTAAVLLAGGYLSFASWPTKSLRHLTSMLMIAALVAALVLVARRGGRWLAAVLHLGTAMILLLQVAWFPVNKDFAAYDFPTSVAELRGHFGDRYRGTTFQVADLGFALGQGRPWHDLLFGNMYRAAGVAAVPAYTGIGHVTFHRSLCLAFTGATCPDAYATLWRPVAGSTAPLADAMRLETVVVQRKLIGEPQVPPGWRVTERDDVVTVLRRDGPLRWPDGRLGIASPNLEVTGDVSPGPLAESVRFRRVGGGPARLVFARVDWPGYRAEVNGVPVPVDGAAAGLVAVDLPDSVSAGALRLAWTPPGLTVGLVGVAAGLLGAVALSVVQYRRRYLSQSAG